MRPRSPVPYDIWATVVAFADFYTLSAISLVCRELKYEAAKYIWRSCTLHVGQRCVNEVSEPDNRNDFIVIALRVFSGGDT